MDCHDIEELSGAYALRALPAETLREIEAHLAACDKHVDLAGLRSAAAALALVAGEKRPPRALQRRIMATARRDATLSVHRSAWPAYALATALAVVVVALVAWNLTLQLTDGGAGREAVVRSLGGDAASGELLYLPDRLIAVIDINGLRPLPPAQTYQVWAIDDGKPNSIGLFNASADQAAVSVMQADLSGVETVAVTIEPAGGSPQPTSDPILSADL